jgi:hypothetical protein
MKTYEIYKNQQGEMAVIKVGFSWPGFIFSGFWALSKKLWIWGALGVVVPIISGGAAAPLFAIILGVKGNAFWKDHVLKNGYSLVKTVQAANIDEAKTKN